MTASASFPLIVSSVTDVFVVSTILCVHGLVFLVVISCVDVDEFRILCINPVTGSHPKEKASQRI